MTIAPAAPSSPRCHRSATATPYYILLVALAGFLLSFIASTPLLQQDALAASSLGLTVLTKRNFKKTLRNAELVLIFFHENDGRFTSAMMPIWAEAANQIHADSILSKKVTIAVMDKASGGIPESVLAQKSLPQLRVYRNGEDIGLYPGAPTPEGMKTWCYANIGPAVVRMSSQVELHDFREAESSAVAVLFAPPETEQKQQQGELLLPEYKKIFNSVAQAQRDRFKFVAFEEAATTTPYIKIFTKGDETKGTSGDVVAYDGDLTNAEQLTKFLVAEGTDLLMESTPQNMLSLGSRNLPFAWLFVPKNQHGEDLKDDVRALAKEYAEVVVFMWSHPSQQMKEMGFRGEAPALLYLEPNSDHSLLDDQSMTKETIKTYVDDAVAGRVPKRDVRGRSSVGVDDEL